MKIKYALSYGLMLNFSIFLISCEAAIVPQKNQNNPDSTLTLMVYAGNTGASEWGGLKLLKHLEKATIPWKIQVFVLASFSQNNGDPWNATRLYKISYNSDDSEKLLVSKQLALPALGLDLTKDIVLDMTSPKTLEGFIDFSQNTTFTDGYGLVVLSQNFSGGNILGTQDSLGMRYVEFATVLEGKTLDFVGLDGYGGGGMEFLYDLKDSGVWVVASVGNQSYWDYISLFQVVQEYGGRKDFLSAFKNTVSQSNEIMIYDPKEIGILINALDELIKAFGSNDLMTSKKKIEDMRRLILEFDSYDYESRRYVEIHSLLEGLKGVHPELVPMTDLVREALELLEVGESENPKMTIYLCDGNSSLGYGTLGEGYRSDGLTERAGAVVEASQWYGNRENQSGFLYDLWESNLKIYKEGKLTLLVYMAADNDLAPLADVDINEMEAANYGENVNVVALVDMGEGNGGIWENGRLYEIAHDADGINRSLVSLQRPSIELGLPANGSAPLDMSSKETLRKFIDYVKLHYRSDEYALVIWGHGSGWRSEGRLNSRALGADGDKMMTTAEFGQGIEGFDLSFVGFDICFGSIFEMAWEIRDQARYMAGSQGLIPAAGWDYAQAFNIGNNYNGIEGFLSRLRQGVKNSVENFWIYDLTKVEPVKNSFDALVIEWIATINGIATQTIWQNFLTEEVAGDGEAGNADNPGIWNVDMWSMVDKLSSGGYVNHTAGFVSNFTTSFDDLIVEGFGTGSHGVSLYLCDIDEYQNPALVDPDYFKDTAGKHISKFVLSSPWAPDATNESGFLYQLWYKNW